MADASVSAAKSKVSAAKSKRKDPTRTGVGGVPAHPDKLAPAHPEKLADRVHDSLSGMILARELVAGTPMIEERLAEQLNVSRTPMREAILRLAAEGLLTRHGNRSYAVRMVTAPEFFQSHRVREWLEPEAVELAIGKVPPEAIEALRERIGRLATLTTQERAHWEVDDDLHLMFARASGNDVLVKMISQVRVTTRLFEVASPLRRVRRDGEEHLAILEAFAAGDAKGARRAMVRHIRNLVEETLSVLRGLS